MSREEIRRAQHDSHHSLPVLLLDFPYSSLLLPDSLSYLEQSDRQKNQTTLSREAVQGLEVDTLTYASVIVPRLYEPLYKKNYSTMQREMI
jgi:hypothetical protein